MAGYDANKAKVYNEAIAQGLTEDQALAAAGISQAEADNYEIGVDGQIGKAGINDATRTGTTLTPAESAADPEIETPTPTRTVPVSSNTTTTNQETVTGGTVTTTTVTPTTYKDNDQSRALQAEADAIAAQQEARRAQLRAEGKTGAEILRDPEMKSLSQQKQSKELEAQNAKTVDQAGTATTTTSPGDGTVNQQTVDTQFQTTKTSGDDPTAAAGQDNQYVASGGPVQSTDPQPIPAGEDPYVDLADEGENITEFVPADEIVDQPEAVDDPYVDETDGGITEFTDGDEVRWTEEDTAGIPNPYFEDEPEDAEVTAFDRADPDITEPEGVDPDEDPAAAEADENELVAFDRADADVTEPEGVDPDEDPYAQLVEDTEAEGGLVEFGADGPVGTDKAELDALAAQQEATLANARAQAALKAQRKQADEGDWRVKLRLAPGSNYLYRASNGNGQEAGILQPLVVTDGVVFPYMPTVSTSYRANYEQYNLTHNNYKGYAYQGSAVEEVNVTAIFTAQDTYEAEYLLAVIHFFRSVTKMFYGQDPAHKGSPPPLVFLQGLGEYQFNLHPCVVTQFNYNLPNDVDYIRARTKNQANLSNGLINRRQRETVPTNPFEAAWQRLKDAGTTKGAQPQPPAPPALGTKSPTYVPTRIEMSIVLLPVQSRSQVSKQFSLKQYANGDLLKGGFW